MSNRIQFYPKKFHFTAFTTGFIGLVGPPGDVVVFIGLVGVGVVVVIGRVGALVAGAGGATVAMSAGCASLSTLGVDAVDGRNRVAGRSPGDFVGL